MPYRWSPAADGQFGNAVLTRLPMHEVAAARLPFVQGPMERSYLAVTLRLDGDREVRLVNAHLQHRKENTPTRLVQTRALLDAWGGRPATVIAGDFNFWPSWPEAGLWEEAGFVSAQDATGHGGEFTVPSDAPDNRVDWIFGTPDVSFSDFEILTGVRVSDHFPLLVTVAFVGWERAGPPARGRGSPATRRDSSSSTSPDTSSTSNGTRPDSASTRSLAVPRACARARGSSWSSQLPVSSSASPLPRSRTNHSWSGSVATRCTT